jgi:hypothetical protein
LTGARGAVAPVAIVRQAVTCEPGNPDNDMSGTRSPTLVGIIAGRECHPDDVWHRDGDPITAAEYRFRVADLEWMQEHAPHEPAANPYQATDWSSAPPPF